MCSGQQGYGEHNDQSNIALIVRGRKVYHLHELADGNFRYIGQSAVVKEEEEEVRQCNAYSTKKLQ